jgi:hypothetical protein
LLVVQLMPVGQHGQRLKPVARLVRQKVLHLVEQRLVADRFEVVWQRH